MRLVTSREPLFDTVPQWQPPHDDLNAPEAEWIEVQEGVMRIVRNRKRVRLLKRRGVVMWRVCGVWCWFVDHPRLNAEREKRIRAYEAERAFTGGGL